MTNNKKDEFHFRTEKDISSQEHKVIAQSINEIDNLLCDISNMFPWFTASEACTVLFETLAIGLRRGKPETPFPEYFSFLKEAFSRWCDVKLTQIQQDDYEVNCSLCGKSNYYARDQLNSMLGPLSIPNIVRKSVSEGCPNCWSGKGPMMRTITYYDKEGNIQKHINKQNVTSELLDTVLRPFYEKKNAGLYKEENIKIETPIEIKNPDEPNEPNKL